MYIKAKPIFRCIYTFVRHGTFHSSAVALDRIRRTIVFMITCILTYTDINISEFITQRFIVTNANRRQ